MRAHLGSEVECGLHMLVLGARSTPWVVELKALVTETRPAVSTAFSGLRSLRGFTELTHHCHAAQTYCVSVPETQQTNRSVTVRPDHSPHKLRNPPKKNERKDKIREKKSSKYRILTSSHSNGLRFPHEIIPTQWHFFFLHQVL